MDHEAGTSMTEHLSNLLTAGEDLGGAVPDPGREEKVDTVFNHCQADGLFPQFFFPYASTMLMTLPSVRISNNVYSPYT